MGSPSGSQKNLPAFELRHQGEKIASETRLAPKHVRLAPSRLPRGCTALPLLPRLDQRNIPFPAGRPPPLCCFL